MGLFATEDFPARWYCGKWYDWHGWLHVSSDILIWGAYMAIPIVLLFFVRKRDDIPSPKIVFLFAAFIFVCGTGHLIEAIIFWHPVYYFAGVVKAVTAIVSWCTVLALVKLMPDLLTVPITLEAHKKLTLAMKEMDRSNKMLSEFSSACAHHLKEPLRGIHNYTEIVLRNAKKELGEHEVKKLATVSSLSQRLDSLLTAMLRFSEVYHWKAVKQQVDLHALVVNAKESVAIELEAVNGSILIPKPLPVAFCDETLTQQLFATIFLYAISRASEEGDFQITVESVSVDEELVSSEELSDKHIIVVRDNGSGISAEELDTALNLFGHQVNKSEARTDPKAFLGPSFARALSEVQGESLWVESSLEGDSLGGSTAVFVSFSIHASIDDVIGGSNEKPA